jgi:uncharacterized protein YcbK (DUF882 family)
VRQGTARLRPAVERFNLGGRKGEDAVTGRRQVLAGFGAACLVRALDSGARVRAAEARRLELYNVNTGESFEGAYFAEEEVLPEARRALNRLLRDHHAEAVTEMDSGIFELLWRLRLRYRRARGHDVVVKIHSAYRTEATNEKLRSEGAAWNSLHKSGRAVDVSVEGYGMRFLANHALNIGAGGVGIYWRAGFVHLDTGPARRWYKRI